MFSAIYVRPDSWSLMCFSMVALLGRQDDHAIGAPRSRRSTEIFRSAAWVFFRVLGDVRFERDARPLE